MGEAALANGTTVARGTGTGWFPAHLTSRLSVRAHVVGLILVIVAPLLAFSAVFSAALGDQRAGRHGQFGPRTGGGRRRRDRSSTWIAAEPGAGARQLTPSPHR